MVALKHLPRRETYQRILESAGAKVYKDWTEEDLMDRVQLSKLTHIFSEPDLYWAPGPFQTFLTKAASLFSPFVGSYFYISEYLFVDYIPKLQKHLHQIVLHFPSPLIQ